jgi:hypothetical protein
MATRDADQGAGVESGLSKKQPIGDYMPATASEKTGKPKSAPVEKAPNGHKIK